MGLSHELGVALLVQRSLSNAASFVLCVVCRVEGNHTLQNVFATFEENLR